MGAENRKYVIHTHERSKKKKKKFTIVAAAIVGFWLLAVGMRRVRVLFHFLYPSNAMRT